MASCGQPIGRYASGSPARFCSHPTTRPASQPVAPSLTAHIHISVYRGDPVDLQTTRHMSIYVKFSDGTRVLVHAIGDPGFFEVSMQGNYDPKDDPSCVLVIPVATIQGPT